MTLLDFIKESSYDMCFKAVNALNAYKNSTYSTNFEDFIVLQVDRDDENNIVYAVMEKIDNLDVHALYRARNFTKDYIFPNDSYLTWYALVLSGFEL